VVCHSQQGLLHTSPSFCCAHGDVTHGRPGLCSLTRDSLYSTHITVCLIDSPLGQDRYQFLDEIFSLTQRNLQDKLLGVFQVENLVINNRKRGGQVSRNPL
jgi:hypothetical protein